MNSKYFALLIAAAAAFAGTLRAQQPPDPVSSDGCLNTAMGSDALFRITCSPGNGSNGTRNTAAGYAALSGNSTGAFNIAVGVEALVNNQTGLANTAVGDSALWWLFSGNHNTAVGFQALYGLQPSVSQGSYNTAIGSEALTDNTTGSQNTASGYFALGGNTTGSYNTASGYEALWSNYSGSDNTASGYEALFRNSAGNNNTAAGFEALFKNTTGSRNTADGTAGLQSNTTGFGNTASGWGALLANTTGYYNSAYGYSALASSTIGSNNVALGSNAGASVTTGSNNIEIGNAGTAADHGILRVGTPGTHLAAFIAGINNSHVTGSAVYVTAGGQLGVLASSERYKTAVATMGSGSRKLTELRPVTFRLKTDPKRQTQYGLIAEEVAKLYPELVIRNEAGQAEGVRYEELTPMLLNEVKRQQSELGYVRQQLAELQKLNTAS